MRYKQVAVFLLVFAILLPQISVRAQGLSLSAKASVLMDAATGEVLYEHNAQLRLSMASTTKILTALILLEAGNLDQDVKVTADMIRVEGSSLGLKAGDVISRLDLCYGLLLTSGNDAANVVAHVISGGLEAFAKLMNLKAACIGMNASSFVTPSGLDADDHYTTARDMAVLARYAMRNKTFQTIVSSRSATISVGNPKRTRTVYNHNKLLTLYDGCDGLKTGYTKKSGRCLVTSALRDGVRLICVTLKASDDWNDHKKLLDYGFSCYRSEDVTVTQELAVRVTGGVLRTVHLRSEYAQLSLTDRQRDLLKTKVEIPPFVFAPVCIGDQVGRVSYWVEGNLLLSVPLVAVESSASFDPALSPKTNIWKKLRLLLTG